MSAVSNRKAWETRSYISDMVNRGERLVSEGRCNFFHTPSIDSEERSIPDPDMLLSGHPAEAGILNCRMCLQVLSSGW